MIVIFKQIGGRQIINIVIFSYSSTTSSTPYNSRTVSYSLGRDSNYRIIEGMRACCSGLFWLKLTVPTYWVEDIISHFLLRLHVSPSVSVDVTLSESSFSSEMGASSSQRARQLVCSVFLQWAAGSDSETQRIVIIINNNNMGEKKGNGSGRNH